MDTLPHPAFPGPMACSPFSLRRLILGSGILKGAACSLGLAALWLFPSVGRAQPQPCIRTHASLGLGCLTRDQWDRKIREWAPRYKTVHGFANQWGLGAINADRAYAHLKALMGEGVKPGQGVTIGFVDNGIDPDHPSFVGRATPKKLKTPFLKGADYADHGMQVASVAAGGQISDKKSSHGVAWGADILMVESYTVSRSFVLKHPDSREDVNKYDPEDFARTLQHVNDEQAKKFKSLLSEDIDILNLSWYLARGTIEHYNKRHLRQDYGKTIAALAQADADEKTILVWAAGNHRGDGTAAQVRLKGMLNGKTKEERDSLVNSFTDSPAFGGGLPALIAELRGHSVAVVATKRDGGIADFSNYCGMAADWCIAAPGDLLTTLMLTPGSQQWYWSSVGGTSVAAPMVSGSLAVMKQLFRSQLSNTELVTRLFATANKTGIYANRSIYGQGFLDLGAATNPWGVVGFMGTGQSVGVQAQDAPGEPEPAGSNSCGKGTINTHASLGLGCLTRAELNEKVQEWATAYRAVPGFGKQWGLGAVHADRAYAHLKAVKGESVKPGQGVTIGFVDSGMDRSHPSFATNKVSETLLQGAAAGTSANTSHGTAVASVAAGGRISSSDLNYRIAHHGVAWGADIAMFTVAGEAYPTKEFSQPLSRKELQAREDSDSELFKSVLREDIDILNVSFPRFHLPGSIDDYRRARLVKNYSKTIAALAQADAGEKTILVWSAGDVDPSRGQTPGLHPQVLAGLPSKIKELRGHSVAVVATQQDGAIADFSNRCGMAADWCIAAPGKDVQGAGRSSFSGRHAWVTRSSTSLAAPMVSGGLAVMKQLFRGQLSNTELVSRLFSTAKKTGIHADSSIYGQGLMDLGAATNPWGIPAFMGTGQVVGGQSRGDSVGQQSGGVELSSTSLSLGSAMGDGLSEALARQEIAAFDSLGAPFWFSAGSFTLPGEGPSLAARFQQFLAPSVEHTIPETWQVDFQSGAPALEAGHLALTHGADRLWFHGPQGLSATLFQRPADYDQSPLAGLAVSWNPQALPALSLAAGYLHEQEELLGSQGSGAFGELSGHTLFLSTELDTTTPQGWELSAQGEVGMVTPAVARSQFINDISTLTSSAFRLQARKPLENGAAFRLALSQPLRVESGAASLSLPTGRTKDGLVVGTDLSAPLSPSGRQLDLTAQVDLPLLGGDLSLAATHSRQPQHQQGAEGQWTFFTGYRATW